MAVINGDSGANTLIGTDFADTISGGRGADTIDGGDGNDVLNGNRGRDVLTGAFGNDTLNGGNGHDWMDGGVGDDVLNGGRGNDTMMASDGNDTIIGGNGSSDRVVFSGDRADYTVTELDATTILITGASGYSTQVSTVELFEFADTVQTLPQVTAPQDFLFIGTALDETFVGGAGNDTLTGDNLTDTFAGGEGIDTLDFSQATRSVYAVADLGGGYIPNPTPAPLSIVDPSDPYLTPIGQATEIERLIGSEYQDFLFANGTEITFMDGGGGDDGLIGSEFNDTIEGGNGNDSIGGLYGDDTIFGGDGADQFYIDRDLESGTVQGHGHDVIKDFDLSQDTFYFEYDSHYEQPFDPLLFITQTAEGAVVDYATDSSVLLEGIDAADLNASHFELFAESITYAY